MEQIEGVTFNNFTSKLVQTAIVFCFSFVIWFWFKPHSRLLLKEFCSIPRPPRVTTFISAHPQAFQINSSSVRALSRWTSPRFLSWAEPIPSHPRRTQVWAGNTPRMRHLSIKRTLESPNHWLVSFWEFEGNPRTWKNRGGHWENTCHKPKLMMEP